MAFPVSLMDGKNSLAQSRKDAKNTGETAGLTSCRFEVEFCPATGPTI